MEYAKGKNTTLKFMKSFLSICTVIILAITMPYLGGAVIKAVFPIAVLGVLVWCCTKIVKGIKNLIYKLSTKKNPIVQADMASNDSYTAESMDINYEDSIIIDVDYEKI